MGSKYWRGNKSWLYGFLYCLLLLLNTTAAAQYFGRNKANYRKFDFKVVQSPHFELYHYLENPETRKRFVQAAEQWYSIHQAVLLDTFVQRNPLLLYSNHADFQQTRAIEGLIGVSTGGVTEALKNRVIMPFMETNAQTDHVLGHELVHAFQYNILLNQLSPNALANLPLWMVEGMAEYLSIGALDAHTALWLRSAVANNKLPTLKDLTNKPYEYFPYRWGQAFWAYVTGIHGDSIIKKLFFETGRVGYARALKSVLGIDEKTFTEKWQQSLRATYTPYMAQTKAPAGVRLVDERNAGEMNIVPSISPDGRRLAFWTEKNLFSIDLYVVDAETGAHKKRITTHSLNTHIDEYSSFESSVAWSPDSRQLAFVVFAKGKNRLLITRADNGKIIRQIEVPGVPALSNPAWSPDGHSIVVTGLVDGQSDLYLYHLKTGQVQQLTNDRYADLQPSFSPDGKWIAFATDRLSMDTNNLQHQYAHNIALYQVETGAVTHLPFFKGANNLNPVFAADNHVIYFLSDRDGFRNLYAYHTDTQQLLQLTQLFTGITGITPFAPAISAARSTERLVYTYYDKDAYALYTARPADFKPMMVDAAAVNRQAAALPPFNRSGPDVVQHNLIETPFPAIDTSLVKEVPYRSKFELDYIGNTGVGVAAGTGFGTGLTGGVNGIFSDILGNNQLFGALVLSGGIYDLGAQFAYLNQKRRINWGGSFSHIPYLSGTEHVSLDTLSFRDNDSMPVVDNAFDLLRTYEDQVSFFASLPFSQIRRLEGGAALARYYYRMDRYSTYYGYTDPNDPHSYYYVSEDKSRQSTPEGYSLAQAYVAYVGDNAYFGAASPLTGHRFRLEAGRIMGAANLTTLTADYRRYFRLAPVTVAIRNLYMGRLGKDAATGILPPLQIGYPSLVRGYEALGFAENNREAKITVNDLTGSSIYVANAEVRFPFTGAERLSAIRSSFLFTELNLFTDGGIAWGEVISSPFSTNKGILVPRDSHLVLSSGISLRVNLFGYLVLEPYYAIPWQNGGFRNGSFGLNFLPGW